MKPAALRISEAMGISERSAAVVAAVTLAMIVAMVGLTIRMDVQVQAVGALVAVAAILIALRWPLVPLFAFAALIPIEEAVVVGSLGTLSRYAELLFIVAYGLPRLGRLTISAMPLPGWAYLGWAALSVAWAIDPTVTLQELPILALLFTMAVLVGSAVVEQPKIVRPLLWAYSLSAAATAAIGILEYIRGDLGVANRIAALPGQDPAYYAALLLPALVFSFYQLLNGRVIPLAIVVCVVCTAGVIVSGTRGAWLSAGVVAAVYLLPRISAIQRLATVVIVGGLIAITLQLPGVGALVSERADSALSSGGAGRTDIWSVGLLIYGSAPVTGVGLDNFPVAYTPERIRQSDVTIIAPWRPANRAPHNVVIGTLGELGAVGLVVLASFLIPLLLRRGWGPDAAAVQAAFASLATMAIFLDLLNRKEFWLFLAIACGLLYLSRWQRTQERDANFPRRLSRANRELPWQR